MKLPPYAKNLLEQISKGVVPSKFIYLWIGNKAWDLANRMSLLLPDRTLLLPPWLPAYDYHWPVSLCKILIVDTGYAEQDYIQEIVYSLYKNGAVEVRFLCPNFDLTIYKKG